MTPVPDARLRELLVAGPSRHGALIIEASFVRDLITELLAARGSATPPTRDEVIAHEKHGGFWFVSRVNTGQGREPIRPMVLRVVYTADMLFATIPGIDYAGAWDDDPWALMPGATWTPLTRDGAPMARGTKETTR